MCEQRQTMVVNYFFVAPFVCSILRHVYIM